ncbi:helix-turn-helix domain-containing protein [Acetobacter sp.]|jgi:transcriptional regulator with XRE-family HTH domain|uniref:helix-turn-helix domain-containing protein n=1 Tax=Acetobacter sp. TaxID=440 RepID=UPI0025BDE4FB|nr:helix-turn-helix transcriptional regulator [Acetobacter sp.]MCH4092281.1 helix-turn-helix domain-containing protein [Acetobacter sp.]MCI1299802.1 helix-turn-helix domain-containing protein [Acetobacter sp.]MCI1315820.1 helix-turn-helix domain-containing protein [Acetobacter sp.]
MAATEDGGTRVSDLDAHVGARIRLRRTMLGMSQEKLGEAISLTFQQIQKYERGTNRVSASRLFEIARVLDVPIGFFYDDMPLAPAAASPETTQSAPVMGFAEAQQGFGGPPMPGTPSQVAVDAAVLSRRETLELVRAYYRIPDAGVRKRVLDLIRSMAPSD